jgi:hypothetical protein
MNVRSEDPAGWYPDPAERHDLRYWTGKAWSQDVKDGKRKKVDTGVIPEVPPDQTLGEPVALYSANAAARIPALLLVFIVGSWGYTFLADPQREYVPQNPWLRVPLGLLLLCLTVYGLMSIPRRKVLLFTKGLIFIRNGLKNVIHWDDVDVFREGGRKIAVGIPIPEYAVTIPAGRQYTYRVHLVDGSEYVLDTYLKNVKHLGAVVVRECGNLCRSKIGFWSESCIFPEVRRLAGTR